MEYVCLMCGRTVYGAADRKEPGNHGNCESCGSKIVNANRFGHKTIAEFVAEGKTLPSRQKLAEGKLNVAVRSQKPKSRKKKRRATRSIVDSINARYWQAWEDWNWAAIDKSASNQQQTKG